MNSLYNKKKKKLDLKCVKDYFWPNLILLTKSVWSWRKMNENNGKTRRGFIRVVRAGVYITGPVQCNYSSDDMIIIGYVVTDNIK